RKSQIRDAMLGIGGENALAGRRLEQREVPRTLGQSPRHREQFAAGLKIHCLHQSPPTLALVGLIQLLPLLPIEPQPSLDTIASHGIIHGAHPTDVQIPALGAEMHRKYSAQVM